MSSIDIYTDGGARGNPGPAALGVFIKSGEDVLARIGKKIGENTNNVAEYSAVLEAYNFLLRHKDLTRNKTVNFFMDSELICQQLKGVYKIKNSNLKKIFEEIKLKEKEIQAPFSYSHIKRDKNKEADRLVNMALDGLI